MDNEEFEKWAKTIAKEHANWFNISINLETEEAEIDSSARDLLQKAFLAGQSQTAKEIFEDLDKLLKKEYISKESSNYLALKKKHKVQQ